jgi:hypothetical protein
MEAAVDRFAREILVDAFDQAVDAVTRSAELGQGDFAPAHLASGAGSAEELAKRDRHIAAVAAETALAAFFANMEAVGGCRVVLQTEDGRDVELEAALREPVSSMFFSDGWIAEFSRHRGLLGSWLES